MTSVRSPVCLTIPVIHSVLLVLYVIDLENLVQHVKFIKSMEHTEPWKSGTVKALDPAPNCSTDEQIRGALTHSEILPNGLTVRFDVDYVLNNHGTCWRMIPSFTLDHRCLANK